MEPICVKLFCLSLLLYQSPVVMSFIDAEVSRDSRLVYRSANGDQPACAQIQPLSKDIVKRFYAILPYFDNEHSNTAFLHKYRATAYSMSDSEDILDREVAFYTSVLTPVIFLHNHRDTWCLLERFHHAVRLFQQSHPTEKRIALKLLQNIRAVNNKILAFINELPGHMPAPSRTSYTPDFEDEKLKEKQEIRYLKEIIKNLG